MNPLAALVRRRVLLIANLRARTRTENKSSSAFFSNHFKSLCQLQFMVQPFFFSERHFLDSFYTSVCIICIFRFQTSGERTHTLTRVMQPPYQHLLILLAAINQRQILSSICQRHGLLAVQQLFQKHPANTAALPCRIFQSARQKHKM